MDYDVRVTIDEDKGDIHLDIIPKGIPSPSDSFGISLQLLNTIYETSGRFSERSIPAMYNQSGRDSVALTREEVDNVVYEKLPEEHPRLMEIIDDHYPSLKYKSLPMAGLLKVIMDERVSKEI